MWTPEHIEKYRQTPERRNQLNRERHAKRIAEAREHLGGVCVICGTTENLQFDHIDPKTKLFDVGRNAGRVRLEVFWTEVAKCQLLCLPHHREKSSEEGRLLCGELNAASKLSESDVASIRAEYAAGRLQREIAEDYGIHQATVSKIILQQRWINKENNQ